MLLDFANEMEKVLNVCMINFIMIYFRSTDVDILLDQSSTHTGLVTDNRSVLFDFILISIFSFGVFYLYLH